MGESYCGKSCSECSLREALNCPGCKMGPGQKFSVECELAQCCRIKGHEECDTCEFKENCDKLRRRNVQAENRKIRFDFELHQKKESERLAATLGKWLRLLFWIVILHTIANFMGSEYVINTAPGVYMAGIILGGVCSITYSVILFKLLKVEDQYLTAGICTLISGVLGFLVGVFFGEAKSSAESLILTLPAAIVALTGVYHEFKAHSLVLYNVDDELSEDWSILWKWYIGCLIGMIGGAFLTAIVPIIGVIVVLGATIGSIIVDIKKMVYLYRTSKAF